MVFGYLCEHDAVQWLILLSACSARHSRSCTALAQRKHWPRDIAESYFSNKQIFGLLRDPYERLVAMFRGGVSGYGGNFAEELKTCDVDSAVRKMMLQYLSGDIYAEGCTFLPQAEFFDPPFGITVPVDNRWFPDTANDVLAKHGYTNMRIATDAWPMQCEVPSHHALWPSAFFIGAP